MRGIRTHLLTQHLVTSHVWYLYLHLILDDEPYVAATYWETSVEYFHSRWGMFN